jgi:hypothetical protein
MKCFGTMRVECVDGVLGPAGLKEVALRSAHITIDIPLRTTAITACWTGDAMELSRCLKEFLKAFSADCD